MICPVCIDNNIKSQVRCGNYSADKDISDVFYDEEGKMHSHYTSYALQWYHCTNDHKFASKDYRHCFCDGCDYGTKKEFVYGKERSNGK